MGRHKSPFNVYQRRVGNRKVYYARFFDPVTQEVKKTLSTGESNKRAAYLWAEAQLERIRRPGTAKSVGQLAKGFWDYESAFARSRRARGKSLSAGYLDTCEINTRRHVLPRWKDVPLQDLSKKAIDQWLLKLYESGELAPATINKVLQLSTDSPDGVSWKPNNSVIARDRMGTATSCKTSSLVS